MVFGPDEWLQCNACARTFRLRTWVSWNTIGATQWTDGKVWGPMLPSDDLVVVCPYCNTAHLRSDIAAVRGFAGEVLKMRASTLKVGGAIIAVTLLLDLVLDLSESMWPAIAYLVAASAMALVLFFTPRFSRQASESDFLKLATAGGTDTETERKLRLRAFWAANDEHRASASRVATDSPALTPDRRENLERLYELLPLTSAEERLLAAETLRHLGGFDAASQVLRAEFEDGWHRQIADFIAALAREQDTRVHPLPKAEKP